jgi:hypothetical protein
MALQLASDYGFDRIEMTGGPGGEFAILAQDIVPRPRCVVPVLIIIRHDRAPQLNSSGKSGQDRRGNRQKTGNDGEKHRRNLSLFNNQFERHFFFTPKFHPRRFTVRNGDRFPFGKSFGGFGDDYLDRAPVCQNDWVTG